MRDRTLEYTPERFVDLVGSMDYVAASGKRAEIMARLRPLLGLEPFDVTDLVWSIAARRL
jgi:hypothetical protein